MSGAVGIYIYIDCSHMCMYISIHMYTFYIYIDIHLFQYLDIYL